MNRSLPKRQSLVWLVFTLTLLSTAWVLTTRFKVQSDLWAFLPTVGDTPEQRLTRDLLSGQLSRTLVLAVVPKPVGCVESNSCSSESRQHALSIARKLSQSLAQHPAMLEVNSGPAANFESAVHDLYFPRRFNLATAVSTEPYDKANIEERVQALKIFLASPKASLYRSQLVADPLLYFPEQIEKLASLKPSGVELVGGQFATQGGIALLFSSTRTNLGGDEKAQLYHHIQSQFKKLNAPAYDTQLMTSGALPFEVQGEASSRADMQRVGLVSTVMAALLSLILFRSLLVLLAIVLPVALAFAVGCAVTLLLFGEVHVLTLAFGASLIGVSLDYPLHLFNEAAELQGNLRTAKKHVTPGLLIGCLTTIVGFLAFGLTSATALLQVAVFAISGLVAALLVTLFILPQLRLKLGTGGLQRWLNLKIEAFLPWLSRRAWTLTSMTSLGLLASAVPVFFSPYQSDPHALDPSPLYLKNEDRYVRSQLGVSEDMLVVTASSQEEAMSGTQQLAKTLQHLKAQGKIESFRSLAALYLPEQLQRKNREKSAASATRELFFSALKSADFESSAFAESPLGTAATAQLPLLTLQELLDSPLGSLAKPLFFSNEKGASAITQITASPQQIHELVQANPAVTHYQPEKFLALSFSQLAHNIKTALLIALGLMLTIVAVRNRTLRATIAAFLPAASGALGSLALLSLAGPLHVFHLLAAVVVLSMGIDYGTFMVEAHKREGRPNAWPSVIAAAGSTLVSFGGLAFSSVPALQAIGQVIALGIFIALIATPVCYSIMVRAKIAPQQVRL